MLVSNFSAGATTASTAVSFLQDFNTNSNLSYYQNSVKIMYPGVYEIIGSVTLTSTAEGATGLALYADGSVISNSFVFDAAAASDTSTVAIYDTIQIDATVQNTYVTLNFMPINTPTIVAGTFSIKQIH